MGEKSPQPDIESSVVALRAFRAGFRPLAQLLLQGGVQIRDVIEVVKTVFVEVARKDFARKGKPANFSRTALLTGIDRKEIRRLWRLLETSGDPVEVSRRRQDRIACVLDTWNTNPEYVDKEGRPRLLTRLEFNRLARMHAGDIPTSAILREMIFSGSVIKEPDDSLRAERRNHQLHRTDPESVLRAGSVLEDIGKTVVFNLMRSDAKHSRAEGRATVELPVTAIDEFQSFIQESRNDFLEAVDNWLVARSGKEGPKIRAGVGIYQIQDGTDHEKDDLTVHNRNDT